jgi:3',5'-cyclic AMP phosphodiesterase CpdA
VTTTFSYVHLSDFHFCTEPLRLNALNLIKRDVRKTIDTWRAQGQQFGIASVAKPASYVPSITSGVAQFCLKHTHSIDGIIISGDLATTGMATDIGVARAFVDDAPLSGFRSESHRPTLQSARRPIYVLPGNHDRYANNYATTNSRLFDFAFESYLHNFNGYVGHWVRRKTGQYLGFVYADFTLRARSDATTRLGAYGQGRVYQDVFDDLKKRTFALRSKYSGINLCWMLHFAPFDCGLHLELVDWQQIAQAASAAGVSITLCGHTHAQAKIQSHGHTIYCAGSAGCVDSENSSTVHVLRFEIDGSNFNVRRENYNWNGRQIKFERGGDD